MVSPFGIAGGALGALGYMISPYVEYKKTRQAISERELSLGKERETRLDLLGLEERSALVDYAHKRGQGGVIGMGVGADYIKGVASKSRKKITGEYDKQSITPPKSFWEFLTSW